MFKDKSMYRKKDDYGKMMDMLYSYTMAGKNKHDDVPDGWQCFQNMHSHSQRTKCTYLRGIFR